MKPKMKLTALERAAMRVWRQRNNVDAEFWRIDVTCKCAWCAARRAFRQACEDRAQRKAK